MLGESFVFRVGKHTFAVRFDLLDAFSKRRLPVENIAHTKRDDDANILEHAKRMSRFTARLSCSVVECEETSVAGFPLDGVCIQSFVISWRLRESNVIFIVGRNLDTESRRDKHHRALANFCHAHQVYNLVGIVRGNDGILYARVISRGRFHRFHEKFVHIKNIRFVVRFASSDSCV